MAQGAHCHLCPLFKDGVIVPPSPATRKVRLVIVGEGPGRADEKMQGVFSGMAGKLLDKALGAIPVRRNECHITNTALCRGEGDKENERAAECCAPRLLRELQPIDPLVPIVTLGKAPTVALLGVRRLLVARGFIWRSREIDTKTAKRTLLTGKETLNDDERATLAYLEGGPATNERITAHLVARDGRAGADATSRGRNVTTRKLRRLGLVVEEKRHGKTWYRLARGSDDKSNARAVAELRANTVIERAKIAGRMVLPTIAPSFVLRADICHPVWQLDMSRVGRAVRGELPAPTEDIGTERVGGLEVLRGLGPVVSLDVETDGIHPRDCKMLCVGVSDGARTSVIWPWKASYAKRFTAWLRTRRAVVCHNGYQFDQQVLRNHGVE